MEVTVLLGFIMLVAANIYAVLQVAESQADHGRKATWIGVVIVLPVLGFILWYLTGPGRPD